MTVCLCQGEGKRNELGEHTYASEWKIETFKDGFWLDVNEEYAIKIVYCPICGKELK
jgi:hypothetical protein